jgi:hypothetical protein
MGKTLAEKRMDSVFSWRGRFPIATGEIWISAPPHEAILPWAAASNRELDPLLLGEKI